MAKPVADYSFSRPNDYAELARSVSGVMRYTSNSFDNPKNISAAEYQLLTQHNIPVGITWENEATSMLGGASAGRSAAQWSLTITRQAGIPDGVTYYAADQDFTLGGPPTSQLALSNCRKIADFLTGAASVTGWDQVGCYGSLYLLQWLRANTQLKYGWQCAAWSGGRWANWQWSGPVDPVAGFIQDRYWSDQNPISISGCPVDLSTITGDWRPRTATPNPNNGEFTMDAAAAKAFADLTEKLGTIGAILEYGDPNPSDNKSDPTHYGFTKLAADVRQLQADVAAIKAKVGA